MGKKISIDSEYEKILSCLIREAVEECKIKKVKQLHYRIIEGDRSFIEEKILKELGFEFMHRRIEFRRDLSLLPDDDGSPIQWEEPQDLSENTLTKLAEILSKAGEGDPDFSPDENPKEALKSYMSERDLTSGTQCIHIAKVSEKTAGIIVAQINPETGWSRITYMGLLPEFRGRGLGMWVHRHGFSMMKKQGGKLYHGGTLAQNVKMIHLFEKHGCEVYRNMQGWMKRL
jgi:ribosomal protein S18 acetylase RimI-like enzyme